MRLIVISGFPSLVYSNHSSIVSLFKMIYLFAYFCLCWGLHLCGLSLNVAGRGYSLWWLLLLWRSGSRAWGFQELWCMGLSYSLAWGSSLTGDQTLSPALGRWTLYH